MKKAEEIKISPAFYILVFITIYKLQISIIKLSKNIIV